MKHMEVGTNGRHFAVKILKYFRDRKLSYFCFNFTEVYPIYYKSALLHNMSWR